MTTPAHPGRMLFVNIPVADLERSKAFFAKLGFSFNPNFTDETAACMLVGEQASVMLLRRHFRSGGSGPAAVGGAGSIGACPRLV